MSSKPKKDGDEVAFEDILSSINIISSDDERVEPTSELRDESFEAENTSAEESEESQAEESEQDVSDERGQVEDDSDNVLVLTDIASSANDDEAEEIATLDEKGKSEITDQPEEDASTSEDDQSHSPASPSFEIPELGPSYDPTDYTISVLTSVDLDDTLAAKDDDHFQKSAKTLDEDVLSAAATRNLQEVAEAIQSLEAQGKVVIGDDLEPEQQENKKKGSESEAEKESLQFDGEETALERLIHEIFVETLNDLVRDYLKDYLVAAIENIAEKELMKRHQKQK